MTFYDEMAALALELLTEFGADATVTRRGTMAPDADGKAVETGASSATCKCIEIVAGTRMGIAGAGAASLEGGTKRFDASHILSTIAGGVAAGDKLAFKGQVLVINDVRTVNPIGTTLLHFVSAGKP